MTTCPTGTWPGRGFCRALVLLVALAALVPAMASLFLLSAGAAVVSLVTRQPPAEPWYPVLIWMRHLRAVLDLGTWLEGQVRR
ncbi:MAG: hypothetical protein HZB16_04090 [Armatimonadetes bacterium]|nr:hypothetical protein [Armatimonadota bacterium]